MYRDVSRYGPLWPPLYSADDKCKVCISKVLLTSPVVLFVQLAFKYSFHVNVTTCCNILSLETESVVVRASDFPSLQTGTLSTVLVAHVTLLFIVGSAGSFCCLVEHVFKRPTKICFI